MAGWGFVVMSRRYLVQLGALWVLLLTPGCFLSPTRKLLLLELNILISGFTIILLWLFIFIFCCCQTVRFKNELVRNITIKLGYANAKVSLGKTLQCCRPGSPNALAVGINWKSWFKVPLSLLSVFRSTSVTTSTVRGPAASSRAAAAQRTSFPAGEWAARESSACSGTYSDWKKRSGDKMIN